MFGPCLIMQYILFSFAIISLKVKYLVVVHYILSVFLLICGVSGLCLFSGCCGLVSSV